MYWLKYVDYYEVWPRCGSDPPFGASHCIIWYTTSLNTTQSGHNVAQITPRYLVNFTSEEVSGDTVIPVLC